MLTSGKIHQISKSFNNLIKLLKFKLQFQIIYDSGQSKK
jgi:hypothetical protein